MGRWGDTVRLSRPSAVPEPGDSPSAVCGVLWELRR